MLETVDLRAHLTKEEYRETQKKLDLQLAQLQRELRGAGIPALVVFEGWDAAGKGAVLSRLLQAFDPRGFKVHNIGPATAEEGMRPAMCRFWHMVPARGLAGIYNHSWYRQVLAERVEDESAPDAWHAVYERIRVFEHQLADDGAVIVKFFLHISKKEQAKRLWENA